MRAVAVLLAALALPACASDPALVPPLPADASSAGDASIAEADAQDAGATPQDARTADSGTTEDASLPDVATAPYVIPAEPAAQRAGDAQRGYAALLDEGYVGCGIPSTAYDLAMGSAPAHLRLPGRNARNASLPYSYTRFTTTSSVEVVTANCLTCHAGTLGGQVVVGLGNASADFTTDPSSTADLVGLILSDPAEIREWQKWAERIRTTAPYIRMPTVGVNPADNLAAILFAHRDPTTLAWSSTPILEVPPAVVAPVDVPAWWLLKHKSSMFHVGGGRGDHARIMMTASTLCVDTVAEAETIDAYFPDVRAYILSLEGPAYPFTIDQPRAARGRTVFEATCARCHGTYGEPTRYPSLLVPIAEIGTDALLATGSAQYAARFVDWFNGSWYGQRARLEPQPGYIAPPLEGVWATAPYFHNGAVPTLAAVLDSSARPTYWTRSFGTALTDYDEAALGWKTTVLDHGHADEPNASRRRLVYDTTLLGYGNGGHVYGDALSADDRADLLEYLKTL